MARRQKPRRGVVLLIILTLLTLLTVVGLTFAILSGQFRRAAETGARKGRYGDPEQKLVDRAMYQLLRDSFDVNSVVRGHSLLRDMYGESLRGQQTGAAAVGGGGQFLDFDANLDLDADSSGTVELAEVSQGLRTSGFLNGSVLTFVSGPMRNISTRVVAYWMDTRQTPPVAHFRVLAANRDDMAVVASGNLDVFVINGRAFTGTGAGYEGDTTAAAADYGRMSRVETFGTVDFPSALLPNRAGEVLGATQANYMQGGLNESYDAADYQNVALAALIPKPGHPGQVDVLPSFHQVALINYWAQHNSGMWSPGATSPDATRYREFRRRVIFRPMPWDHPNFDGGNMAFAAPPPAVRWDLGLDGAPGRSGVDDDGLNGPDEPGELGWPGSDDVLTNDAALNSALLNASWDVDCDGDGTPDAVWLDLGMPIQTDASGRRYKPLFAVLCTDLDGKLNVNAHGDLSHVATVAPFSQSVPYPITLPGNTTPIVSNVLPLPKGQGYGPPEVTLVPLFGSVAEYAALLQGNAILGLPGRYGFDQVPGVLNTSSALAQLKLLGYPPALPVGSPTNYFLPTTPLSSFNNPFDLRGEFAFGLDYRGASLHERSLDTNLLLNTAYEIDLSNRAPRGVSATTTPDTPYSIGELERLLRANDLDAYSLPNRLWRIVDTFRTDPAARRGVTTDSYDVPSPSIQPWPELLAEFRTIGMDRPRHIVDLIRTRMIAARGLTGAALDNAATIDDLNHDLERLIPADMISGTRFDVNRPFGNGMDDPSPVTGNLNRVVDDHGVGAGDFRGEDATALPNLESFWGIAPYDHDNDGVTDADNNAFLARHYYAKHLYCLMMAIKPRTVEIDFDGNPANNTSRETAYGLAQWAINVVDFRDADSIMTPFEFDIEPFTNTSAAPSGWSVDGVLGTADDDPVANPDRGLVWGCERPELLISEAFAFHDRRTEDLSVNDLTTDTPADPDFDQRLRPRGSFFVELYNPWAGDEGKPGEFYYDHITNSWSPGVMLNQVTPGPAQFPVWRMVVAKGTDKFKDPDHWDSTVRMPVGALERSVYFTPFAGPISGAERPYFTNLPVAPILPGRYAVIGSAGQTVDETNTKLNLINDNNADEYVTTLGRLTTAVEGGGLNYAGTRSIVLEPSLDLARHQAQVLGNAATTPEPLPPDIQPTVGIVINQPLSLSVTEPVTGYPATGPAGEIWNPILADYEGAYTPTALDAPLDSDPELVQNGTTDDYCVVHLQRLANPLLPYDAAFNPYLTIDSMSSDMTSFNGVATGLDPNAAGTNEQRMTTRERGDSLTPAEPRALWKHQLAAGEVGGVPSDSSDNEATNLHILAEVLDHSLGYLNEPYRTDGTLNTYFYNAATAGTLAPPTAFPPGPLSNRNIASYIGAPALVSTSPLLQNPFPWLNWHNRPFVSQYDLMLVPKTRSSRLPIDYAITPSAGSEYAPNSVGSFGHLLNFFQTSDTMPANGANLYRLFELTHVPSRFMDTETYFNPFLFAGSAVDNTIFHPPFNYFPQFRVPGLINLNTAYDQGIWTGIQAGHNYGPNWAQIVSTRRGYGAATTNIRDLDSAYPTLFANPFRAVGGGALVPPSGSPTQWDRLEVETTLLRSDSYASASPTDTLFEHQSNEPYNNTDRNPYFRYQGIDRLGNLLTTRSNVYAVWITVGYFEVEPIPDTGNILALDSQLKVHPDGFRLGKELGSDAGTVQRHRAFYVIDRTQPVAFEPGENHNVDRAVILRRYIE